TWHFFEYRGYGARKSEKGDYTLDEITQDLSAYLRQLSATKVSLLGHSMGGTYMQRVLIDSPIPVASMIGISPTPASGTPFDAQTRALFESAGYSSESRRTIIEMTTGNRLSGEWLDHMVAESFVNSEPRAVGEYFRAWADCNFAKEIKGTDIPILA